MGKVLSVILDKTGVFKVNTFQILKGFFFFFFFFFFVNGCSNSNKRGGAAQTVNTCIWWVLVLK